MNTKLILAICCAIGMGAVPLAGAHLTNPNGSWTSGAFTGDNCRYAGNYDYGDPNPTLPYDAVFDLLFNTIIYPEEKNKGDTCPNLNNGVSGTYVGATTAFIEGDIFPLTIAPLITLLPQGNGAIGATICDFEVGGQGGGVGALVGPPLGPKNDPTDLLFDEKKVDKAQSGPPPGGQGAGLLIPDGTWDDGGLGGACHTQSYANPNFNTPGCSGTSHAEDAAVGPNIWIGAGCDFFRGVADDCENFIFTGGATLQECIDSITCQITSPATCSPTFIGCGPDSAVDAVNNGEGGGSVQFAAGVDEKTGPLHSLGFLLDNKKKDANWEFFGVRYPTIDATNGCPAATGNPVTFIYHGVKVNLGDIIHKLPHTVEDIVTGSGVLAGTPADLLLRGLLDCDFDAFPGPPPVIEGPVLKCSNGKQSYPNWEHTFATAGWIDWTPDSLGEGTLDGNKVDIKDGLTIGLCKLPLPAGPFPNLGTLIQSIPNASGGVLLTCPKDNTIGVLDPGLP